jgi:lysophospholipase L1-like esterase
LSRLKIFAKGNLDLRDSLHAHKLGGALVWNGINELLRSRRPSSIARVQHETWGRSDALLAATGTIPATLIERAPPLDAFSLQSQFSQALFETDADVIALSIQPDVSIRLARHRQEGFLFYPHRLSEWPAEQKAWLRETCSVEDFLDVDTSMANFSRIVARIRQRSQAAILIYNLSSVVPGERIHSHEGFDDLFSTRIRRFNLGLIELSQTTGVSIIDVDGLLARAGAERLKIDPIHLNGEGSRLVAEEVVRVLDDLGCLPPSDGSV